MHSTPLTSEDEIAANVLFGLDIRGQAPRNAPVDAVDAWMDRDDASPSAMPWDDAWRLVTIVIAC